MVNITDARQGLARFTNSRTGLNTERDWTNCGLTIMFCWWSLGLETPIKSWTSWKSGLKFKMLMLVQQYSSGLDLGLSAALPKRSFRDNRCASSRLALTVCSLDSCCTYCPHAELASHGITTSSCLVSANSPQRQASVIIFEICWSETSVWHIVAPACTPAHTFLPFHLEIKFVQFFHVAICTCCMFTGWWACQHPLTRSA